MFVLDTGEIVYTDLTPPDRHVPPGRMTGLVPRDMAKFPKTMFATPNQLTPFDDATLRSRIKDQLAAKARLSDIRDLGYQIPSRDQNGKGYCWAHSTTGAIILYRKAANLPYVSLSAFSIACIEKGYRDEGGWCGESARFATEIGVAGEEFWPQQSMSRSNDNANTRANMGLHKIVSGWYDLTKPEYSQVLNFQQCCTLLVCNVPGAFDYNWWGHSVCGSDVVDGTQMAQVSRYHDSGKLIMHTSLKDYEEFWGINHPVTGGLSIRIWNSWSDSWGARGMGVLTGSKAIPDNAIAIIDSVLSAK